MGFLIIRYGGHIYINLMLIEITESLYYYKHFIKHSTGLTTVTEMSLKHRAFQFGFKRSFVVQKTRSQSCIHKLTALIIRDS